jgi:antirestriction protein
MNTEKIEKLKKSLSNSKIPADLKPKIEAEIKRLEDLDAKNSPEPKEDEKPVAKTRKPRTTKTVTKKTSTAKPSQTSKPKRTAMSVAKEIRKDGESWKDAMARASKVMKEKSKTATKDVETELQKLTKLVRGKKELKGQVGKTNLLIDAKRKAKPMGRRVSKDGNVYYENRANRTDRGTYGKYHLAEGGDLMKGLPENFEVEIGESEYTSEKGNGVNYYGMILYKGYTFKYFSPYDSKKDVKDSIKRYLKSLSVSNITLDNSPEKGDFSVYYKDRNGVHLHTEDSKEDLQEFIKDVNKLKKSYAEGGYLTDPNFGNFQTGVFAKGGGVRTINGREYSYGRNWTNDHNLTNKGEEHEVSYTRKKLAKGGGVNQKKYNMQFNVGKAKYVINTYDGVKKNKDGSEFYDIHIFKTKSDLNEFQRKLIKDGYKYSYADGGGIPNNYEEKTPEEVWNMWTEKQKQHFLVDHFNHFIVEEFKGKNLIDISRLEYKKLPLRVRLELDFHVNKGQYADGGLTDLTIQNVAFAKGGGVRTINGREYSYGRNWTNDHNLTNKGEEHEVTYKRKRFELGGNVVTDLAGHTGGGNGGLNAGMPLDGFSNTSYTGLVGETGAMSSGEMFMNGGGLPSGVSQSYMITESLGNPAQHFAKGGGVRKVGNREYSYGRNWTNDHRHINQDEEHEVTYNRKGKFLGVFADGGGVKGDKYDGKTEKIVEELKNLKGGLDNKAPYVYQRDGYIYVSAEEGDNYADYDNYLYIDEKLEDFADKYDTYWDWENAGAIILVPLSDGYATGGVMATGGGVDDESPKIYVADLEAYNNGRLSGVWLDLADYNDADELMEAIQDFLKTSGGEEYAIHDVEYIPNSMYSEYMGQKDFEELYEMIDLAKQNDLPLSVVQEVISQYDSSAVDEFYGKYDDAEDFAQSLVDDLGIESFTDFEYYLYITDTDRRLLAQDMADSYVEGIIDEDGGNRIIEEAGLDLDEYEEAESDRQEEMIDEAREIVYDEYYNTWIEGLSDPYYFLVEEQGMYDAESFANASFVRIDFEKLADGLEQDYTFIYDGGSLYVFNIR